MLKTAKWALRMLYHHNHTQTRKHSLTNSASVFSPTREFRDSRKCEGRVSETESVKAEGIGKLHRVGPSTAPAETTNSGGLLQKEVTFV